MQAVCPLFSGSFPVILETMQKIFRNIKILIPGVMADSNTSTSAIRLCSYFCFALIHFLLVKFSDSLFVVAAFACACLLT